MKLSSLLAAVTLAVLASACRLTPDYGRPLPPGAPALLPLGPNEHRPDFSEQFHVRAEILPALENSIGWMRKNHARQFFPIEGVTHERALASLVRFREVLTSSRDEREFGRRLEDEFTVYKSAGWNGRGGGVLFTGYCTPILSGSLLADTQYRHPHYGLPEDLVKGPGGEILGQRTTGGLRP
jgi:membrane-bound lytic murein transglycosylase A